MSHSEFDDAYEDEINGMERVEGVMLETSVDELMHANPVVVDADASVVATVNTMNERRMGCVLVQKSGKLVGIFTERDVLRKVVFHDGNRSWKVETVMTPNPVTLPPTASVAFALNKMSVDGYRHIPIVDKDGKAIGILSMKQIVHFVADFFPKAVLNLPHDPHSLIPKTADGG